MSDLKLMEALSNAFGPSGFEESVCRVLKEYGKADFDLSADAMNNLYATRKGMEKDPKKPMMMLDAHLDEVGFMVQAIQANGLLRIVSLGGIALTNIPAHGVVIRTESGKMVKGVTSSKPPHFMTAAERSGSHLEMEKMYIDVGASSREEVIREYGIGIGNPVMPDVSFSYDDAHGICRGKAFDNRLGCYCVAQTMKRLGDRELAVNLTGAFAAQEEVGTRGAAVTAQVVAPDLAIVFEGTPCDDLYDSAEMAQGVMGKGTQIRHMDTSYISNPRFVRYAHVLGDRMGIPYQETVRRGGGTNAGRISLTRKAVPVLVLGVPTRYIHTHYNYCALSDVEATIDLAVQVIAQLTTQQIAEICGENLLA